MILLDIFSLSLKKGLISSQNALISVSFFSFEFLKTFFWFFSTDPHLGYVCAYIYTSFIGPEIVKSISEFWLQHDAYFSGINALLYCSKLVFKGTCLCKTCRNFSSNIVWGLVFPMLWSSIFRVLLKISRLKVLYDFSFFPWRSFKISRHVVDDMSLWWSERQVSKLSDNLRRLFLFVRIRSIQVAILEWWQVGLFIRHERAELCIKLFQRWFPTDLKSPIIIMFLCRG